MKQEDSRSKPLVNQRLHPTRLSPGEQRRVLLASVWAGEWFEPEAARRVTDGR